MLLFHYYNATAPVGATLSIKVLTKRQMGEKLHLTLGTAILLLQQKAAPEVGRGVRLISTAGCVPMRYLAEKQRKERHQEDKRFMSSA